MDMTSLIIGFMAGVVVTALVVMLFFGGRLKSLAIGKDGLKLEAREVVDQSQDDLGPPEVFIEILISGRWSDKEDKPGSRFGRYEEGLPTPSKVQIRPGEVYSFDADFGIGDADLKRLAGLAEQPQFRYLTLYRCRQLTPASLANLGRFVHLWSIDLRETPVSDQVLESFAAMRSLRLVDIRGCRCSIAAVDKLRTKLRGCEIRF